MSLNVLLNGAQGRMGQAIEQAAAKMDATIVAALDAGDKLADVSADFDVAIDFSLHDATAGIAEYCASKNKPLVIGTTGHTQQEREAILAFSKSIPIVWAGNYSVGVNLLNYLVSQAASILDDSYHPEVIEMHHRHKKDAPSGTAEALIDIICKARKLGEDQKRFGRKGLTGERPDKEIGIHVLRGGDVVGDHTVMFAGEGERIELSHRASDRRIFAEGALRAANWVGPRDPGVYGMYDVLGLSPD